MHGSVSYASRASASRLSCSLVAFRVLVNCSELRLPNDLTSGKLPTWFLDSPVLLSNMKAYQVPQSSQVESPSRYLKQGEPSMRHEEIEKGRSFAAEVNLGDGIALPLPEMMVEIGEKDVPLVEKPISVVKSSVSSVQLTECVNMTVDEDDEVDSQRCAMDTVEGYRVKPESRAMEEQFETFAFQLFFSSDVDIVYHIIYLIKYLFSFNVECYNHIKCVVAVFKLELL